MMGSGSLGSAREVDGPIVPPGSVGPSHYIWIAPVSSLRGPTGAIGGPGAGLRRRPTAKSPATGCRFSMR